MAGFGALIHRFVPRNHALTAVSRIGDPRRVSTATLYSSGTRQLTYASTHQHYQKEAAVQTTKEKQIQFHPNVHSVQSENIIITYIIMVLTAHKSIAPKCSSSNSQVIKTEPVTSTSTASNNQRGNGGGGAGCRRKIAFHPTLGYAIAPPVAPKVQRRNARERNRVKQVNCGFEMLRAHIPTAAKQKKMSKVDTLRHAVEYIQSLQMMLNDKHHNHSGSNGTSLNGSGTEFNPGSTTTEPHHNAHHQYPLTPQTPSFPAGPPSQHGGNESGYDTASSFFSASTPIGGHNGNGLMSPPISYEHSPNNCNSPNSNNGSSVFSYSHHHHQQHQAYDHHVNYYAEQNSEEDELLDVIAKWQDQN